MDDLVCGIDFGTSNSAVAVYNVSTCEPSPHNERLCRPIPSLLYFPTAERKSVFVGDEAISSYVSSNFRGRFLQALKTFLTASSFTETRINGIRYELPDLVALIIKHLKKTAEEATSAQINRVVLGRPVKFAGESRDEDLAMKRLRHAAELAGFKEVSFEFEPVAAARYYQTLVQKRELVLVGDFGGGTSDFTLMELCPPLSKGASSDSTVFGTSGVPFAGNKFDSELMRGKMLHHFGHGSKWWADDKWLHIPHYIFVDICEWHQIPFLRERRTLEFLRDVRQRSTDPDGVGNLIKLIFDNYGYSVFQRIEEAKIRLSSADITKIQCDLKGSSFQEPVSIVEFDQLIQVHIDSIVSSVETLLNSHNVRLDQIDNVFLTGGTSEVRAVKHLFARLFGPEKIRTGKTFTSVAEGLGITAGLTYKC